MLKRLFATLFGAPSAPEPASMATEATPRRMPELVHAAAAPPIKWRTDEEHNSEIRVGGITVTSTISMSAGPGFWSVSGESHYQDALQAAKRAQANVDEPVFLASLVPEPDNPYDSSAVAVLIDPFGKVGYLAREVAARHHATIVAAQPTIVTCPAQLRGGTEGRPSIGVVIDAARAVGAHLTAYDPDHRMDYEANAQYHKMRDANTIFVDETRPFEQSDIEEAVRRYRVALVTIRKYEALAVEKNLFPRLSRGSNSREVNILDRLTICLVKLRRRDEALLEANQYFEEFQDAMQLGAARAIRTRVDKLGR